MSTTTMATPGEIVTAGAASTEIGFGITFSINDKPITLEMPDINQIAKGNFQFAMPEGEKIGFDKLSDFYTGLQTNFTFLPVIDWASQPEPIKSMAGFGLWISNFQIHIESSSLKTFGIDVAVDFHEWQVPGIPALKLVGTSLSVLYNAASDKTFLTAAPQAHGGVPAGAGYSAEITSG